MTKKNSGPLNVRSNDLLCCNHKVITNSFYKVHAKVTKNLNDQIKWNLFWLGLATIGATFCPFCGEIIILT